MVPVKHTPFAIEPLSCVTFNIIPTAIVATGLTTVFEAVFLRFQVVGLAIKEETVSTGSAVNVFVQNIKRSTIYINNRSSAAVLPCTQKHALCGIAATQRE
jgi:hypothetical protein